MMLAFAFAAASIGFYSLADAKLSVFWEAVVAIVLTPFSNLFSVLTRAVLARPSWSDDFDELLAVSVFIAKFNGFESLYDF